MEDLSEELEFAIELAKKAGKIVMKNAHCNVSIAYKKNEHDPVTAADLEADAYIISEIKKKFPEDGILTEESKNDLSRLKKERVWIIDPVDGTLNFKEYALSDCTKKEFRYFAVQIGLTINKEAVLGVLYAPALDELYYASKGSGSYKIVKGKKETMRIKNASKNELNIAARENFLSTDMGKKMIPAVKEWMPYGRVFGYYIAAIADGRIDAYISIYQFFGEWDFCAPQIILEEAGGIMTHINGEKIKYNNEKQDPYKDILAQKEKDTIKFNQ